MMIQPASGPGVCERARCRICWKPCVVISPTRAPFDSSTAFVATVVPWRMFLMLADVDPRLLADAADAGEHALRRVGRRRRGLHAEPAAAVAVAVADQEEVGEGSTDVDPQPVRHPSPPSQPATGANVPAR